MKVILPPKVSPALSKALFQMGLPQNLKQIVGRLFTFADGDHLIAGTITSLGHGPKEGVVLYVSAPRFHGHNIWRLYKTNDGRWLVVSTDHQHIEGQLTLL